MDGNLTSATNGNISYNHTEAYPNEMNTYTTKTVKAHAKSVTVFFYWMYIYVIIYTHIYGAVFNKKLESTHVHYF